MAVPVTIALVFLAGWTGGLAPATALLFGAAIAPTDPVLAADVQVGEPTVDGQGGEDEDEPPVAAEQGLPEQLSKLYPVSDAPALKEIFNAERIRHIAQEARAVCPGLSTCGR